MGKLCLAIAICLAAVSTSSASGAEATRTKIEKYLQPYVSTHNFAGTVLIARGKRIVFEKSYGYSDIAGHVPNAPDTRFHIASLSMQFTAAAAMRLVEQGKLGLDTRVSDIVAGIPNGDTITIRELLAETSGLPDVNDQADYDDLLQHHQTAESLVQRIRGLQPASAPGGMSKREEHSAYNLLALIVEKQTGLSFREVVKREVFDRLDMKRSGIDDDGRSNTGAAIGYEPTGVFDLEPAETINWSAKTGNASAYATAGDEFKWLNGFFGGRLLGTTARETMLDYSAARVGYGWFKNVSKRFNTPVYYMNGRAAGFASFVMYMPSDELSIVVLSNIYTSVATTIGLDLAALVEGKPYEALEPQSGPPDVSSFRDMALKFQFGPDFYRANAVLTARVADGELFLDWPTGSPSPLIPVAKDRYIDRTYWEPVEFHRRADGHVSDLMYDRFDGPLASPAAAKPSSN